MDEKVDEYKKALQEHERFIVYCDADEFPNTMFLTNSRIMFECEKLLGDDYKVMYVLGHVANYTKLCYLIYGVVNNMSPYIVLYKNGIEVARSDNTYSDYMEAPKKLADWIREQLK
jgi:hypothetical protein